MLQPSKLLNSTRELLILLSIFTLLILTSILNLYGEYGEFIEKEFYFTNGKILNIYSRDGYRVLKLYSEDLDLKFTTATYREDLNLDIGYSIRLKLYPEDANITFREYLGGFYIKSKLLSLEDRGSAIRSILLNAISKQHSDSYMREFYQAIFLAQPISKDFRDAVSRLGISHLIAMSGFHLGIVSATLFYILNMVYSPLQQRLFSIQI